jgi:Ser/Thr protein kinase RdoA (MazF antagonist)
MSADMHAFLATMVAPSRPMPIECILALVRQHYGLEARVTRLTGERDENFRLTADHGAEYVLKIANPAENPAETDLQTAALLHIERTDPELPCPRVLRDRTGGTHVRFDDECGAQRTARVLTFLPGRLLGASIRSQRQRAACGRIGARMTLSLRAGSLRSCPASRISRPLASCSSASFPASRRNCRTCGTRSCTTT